MLLFTKLLFHCLPIGAMCLSIIALGWNLELLILACVDLCRRPTATVMPIIKLPFPKVLSHCPLIGAILGVNHQLGLDPPVSIKDPSMKLQCCPDAPLAMIEDFQATHLLA